MSRIVDRSIIQLLFLAVFTSCTNDREEVLHQYATTKCSYAITVAKRDSITGNQIKPLEQELAGMEEAYTALTEPYEDKISELNDKLLEVEDAYVKQYNKVSTEHEAKYGHLITSEYERRIAVVEKVKQDALSNYKHQLELLCFERDSSRKAVQIRSQIQELRQQLHTKRKAVEELSSQIGIRKGELNSLERQLRALQRDLSEEQLHLFTRQLERLNANPCPCAQSVTKLKEQRNIKKQTRHV